MRILVHDYAGHPFQIELSRSLARRGHAVEHAYCASLVTTPRGALQPSADDPASLKIQPVSLDEPLEKFDFVKRYRQENTYGRLAADRVAAFKPDIVLSGNTPLDAQKRIIAQTRATGGTFVYWVQDLIGVATNRLLAGRWMGAGTLIGWHYARLEKRLLRASDRAVVISEDFRPILKEFGMPLASVDVIENWATLDEVPALPRDNNWAAEQGVSDRLHFLYSGTLGLKHNPELLLRLATDNPEADVTVVSQGLGAEWLSERKQEGQVTNLRILPFQPYDRLPEVLASADVLVAILEPDADVFSVPSKVLTYLCARRALLLAVPVQNLAARIVTGTASGLVVSPDNVNDFLAAAARLAAEPGSRSLMAENARAYAEENFDKEEVTDRFEAVFEAADPTRKGA